MELSFQSGLVIENPTADDIRDHLPTEIYSILEAKPGFYVQCHLKFPWPPYGAHEFKVMPRLHGRIRKYPTLPAWSRAWPNQGYLLEYQEGSLAEHFLALNRVQATERLVTLEEVVDCFCKFLRGDASWRTDFEWSKMNLSELRDEPSNEE